MNQAVSGKTRPKSTLVVLVVISVMAVLAIGGSVIRVKGRVHGTEISRDTLRRREFSYLEVPYFHWQLTGIERDPIPDAFVLDLATQKYIVPQQELDANWDLVQGVRGGRYSVGPANVLATYLDAPGTNGTRYWEVWTKANIERAHVLWPEVLALARDDMYHLLPDVFEAARTSANADDLRRSLDQILADGRSRTVQARQRLAGHQP